MRSLLIGLALGVAVGVALTLYWDRGSSNPTTYSPPGEGDPRGPNQPALVSPGPVSSQEARRSLAPTRIDDEVASLQRALQAARLENAELRQRLEQLGRFAADGTGAASRLEAPRQWLMALMPDKFRGITVAELRHMRELDLSSSEVTDDDLEHFVDLPALRRLTLRRTAVGDAGLIRLVRVQGLVRLGLRETKVTDKGMGLLGTMTRLRYLDLNMLGITDVGLAELRSLVELEFLRLNFTLITDDGMQHLASLRCLVRLDLWGTKVTDRGLEVLFQLPKLAHLELGATAVSAEWVNRFKRARPDCYVRSRHGK